VESLIEMIIFPIATNSECHVISLNIQGVLNVSFVEKYENPDKNFLKKVIKTQTVKLKLIEFNKVKTLLKDFNSLGKIEDNIILKGGWKVFIKSKNNTVSVFYNKLDKYPTSIKNLVEYLISISPIDFNIHSEN
jgi:hypothetical protein